MGKDTYESLKQKWASTRQGRYETDIRLAELQKLKDEEALQRRMTEARLKYLRALERRV